MRTTSYNTISYWTQANSLETGKNWLVLVLVSVGFRESAFLSPADAQRARAPVWAPAIHPALGSLPNRPDWLPFRPALSAEHPQALCLKPQPRMGASQSRHSACPKGDCDGQIEQQRETLRLNARNANAHVVLGVALGVKKDYDGEI